MKVNTRLFGEIEIQDDKIITLDKGIVGFPDLTRFTIIFDTEKEEKTAVMWFQSLDEPQFAMPVIVPNDIITDYNPTVNDELLSGLGGLTPENTYCIVTIKVPKDITQMTVNLKAPIIVNMDNMKAEQIIVEDDFEVRYPVYDLLKAAKEGAGK
jgi:flagellar assembly factor FliW